MNNQERAKKWCAENLNEYLDENGELCHEDLAIDCASEFSLYEEDSIQIQPWIFEYTKSLSNDATKSEDSYFVIKRQYWKCNECGHEDHDKQMPLDRDAFYKRAESPKCPKCKSIGFVPIGF